MNSKGQTLILFVIIMPVLLILSALVVDVGLTIAEKIKLNHVTNMILEEYFENRNESDIEEKVKKVYEKNKIPTENCYVKSGEKYFKIGNAYQIDSIFGNIIGIKNYKVSIEEQKIFENERIEE